jgi:glycerol-3-phosphate dehydrogenase (NAD(P)+)
VKSLAIVGAGSWGTALAVVLAQRFQSVRLWVFEGDLAERMRVSRENDLYLPGHQLSTNIEIRTELSATLEGAEIVLSVVPSHHVRRVYTGMLPCLKEGVLLVSATKGLETDTLLPSSQVIEEVVGARFEPQVVVISGPTFAREVAALNPTALVASSKSKHAAECVQGAFSTPTFRLYTNNDPIGVEIGAAIKNVVAIGAGIVHELGLGHNAMAALITRGLAEITRLALALGGKPQTLSGLAGLGDLVLTCTGELSRNRTVGVQLAQGRKLQEIIGSMRMVAEGIKTTEAALGLGRRAGVEMPIVEQMHQMLHFGLPPREAVRRLMERSLRGE